MTSIKNFDLRFGLLFMLLGGIFFTACEKTSNESFNTPAVADQTQADNQITLEPELFEIPTEFRLSPEDYVQEQLDFELDLRDVSGPDCIKIDSNGVAHIQEGCWVNSDIPDYDCDIVARGLIDCYPLANNEECIVCRIWVVLECKDKLFWYTTWILLC